MASAPRVVEEVNRLLRSRDVVGARRALSDLSDGESADGGLLLDCEARVAYIERDFESAIDAWERSYAAFRGHGDHVGFVRVAFVNVVAGTMSPLELFDPAHIGGIIGVAEALD
jgi:hypothetical protein